MPRSSYVRVVEVYVDVLFEFNTSPVGGWVLDFTRFMLISTQVKVVVGVNLATSCRHGSCE